MWFTTKNVDVKQEETVNTIVKSIPIVKPNITRPKNVIKPKVIPIFMKKGCSVLEIFIKKPDIRRSRLHKTSTMEETNTITVIGITVFLFILVLNALLDVLKVREEEKAKRKLNPDGERRQSLAEFANKKMLRRESSKFGTQLFQIAESVAEHVEEKKSQKEHKLYTRGDSINSYLSEKSAKTQTECSAPASIGEMPSEPKLVKRQSVAKIIGMFNPILYLMSLFQRYSSYFIY